MRVLPCADSGLLVEVDDLDAVLALYAALRDDPPYGVTGLVPAARTLLLQLDPARADPDAVERRVRATPVTGSGVEPGEDAGPLTIPVVYDGADLPDVAAHTGLTREEIIAAHTGRPWTVAFCGFSPGFGYLAGGDPRLHVPRRTEPRTRVPAGSVAIAGEFAAVYPRESPGGWQLLGRTDVRTWDLDRDPPGLLRPGVRVRFEEAG